MNNLIEVLHSNFVQLICEDSTLFFQLLNSLPIGVQVFDEEGYSVFFNTKQKKNLGLPSNYAETGKFNVFNDPFLKSIGADKKYIKVYKGETHEEVVKYNFGHNKNVWNTRKDECVIKERIVPIKNNEGKVKFAVYIVEDITELETNRKELSKSQLELEETIKLKEKFFSVIAHDLRSPYNSILGFSKILLNNIEKLSRDTEIRYVEYIYEAAQQGNSLLNNLLQWSKIQTNTLVCNPEKIVLYDLVNCIFGFLRTNIKVKNLKFENNLKGIEIVADKNIVETIMRNVISNAIKFSKEFGTIFVYSEVVDQNLKVVICDEGIGISPDKLKDLHKIGINSHNKTKNENTGLGLILCKEFIEKIGGSIDIESIEGEGTKVFLNFGKVLV